MKKNFVSFASLLLFALVSLSHLQAQEFEDIPDLEFDDFFSDETTAQSSEEKPSQINSKANFDIVMGPQVNILRKDKGHNKENRLNLRELSFDAEASLSGQLDILSPAEAGQIQQRIARLYAEFFFEVSTANSGNNPANNQKLEASFARFDFGFRQLYANARVQLGPVTWQNSIGKMPYGEGVSVFFNPLNFIDDGGSFFEPKSNWQIESSLAFSILNIKLAYFPAIRFHGDSALQANHYPSTDEYSDIESSFKWLESPNRRQMLMLDLALFAGQSNWHLIGYLQEKRQYDFSQGFYAALGLSSTIPLGQHFQLYGEGLLGNGMAKIGKLSNSQLPSLPFPGLGNPPPYLWENADLDQLQFRGLLGVKITPINNFDISFEYRYDGSALSNEQLKLLEEGIKSYNEFYQTDTRQGLFWQGNTVRSPYSRSFDLSQHLFLLSLNIRNLADRFDLLAAYFFSAPDASSMLRTRFRWNFNNNNSYLDLSTYWFFSSFEGRLGAFGMSPSIGSISLELGLSY